MQQEKTTTNQPIDLLLKGVQPWGSEELGNQFFIQENTVDGLYLIGQEHRLGSTASYPVRRSATR